MGDVSRDHADATMATAIRENWSLEGFRPGDAVMLVESPSIYRSDRWAFFRGAFATVIGPSIGGHPEKMSIKLNTSQFLYKTDESGMPITHEIPSVTVCPHQVCHVDHWEASLAEKFPRFSVAKIRYDTHFPKRFEHDYLKAGERVIVLNEFPVPSNAKPDVKPSLYVRRCGTGSGLNWDGNCFERVPADCLKVIPRKK